MNEDGADAALFDVKMVDARGAPLSDGRGVRGFKNEGATSLNHSSRRTILFQTVIFFAGRCGKTRMQATMKISNASEAE